MKSIDRKAAIRDYKDRPPMGGAFALRCPASDRVWVGTSRNLDAARNGVLFILRQGQHRDRALQEEWTTHGEAAFQFEVLETLDADVSPYLVADLLKDKKREWATRLVARTLLA